MLFSHAVAGLYGELAAANDWDGGLQWIGRGHVDAPPPRILEDDESLRQTIPSAGPPPGRGEATGKICARVRGPVLAAGGHP